MPFPTAHSPDGQPIEAAASPHDRSDSQHDQCSVRTRSRMVCGGERSFLARMCAERGVIATRSEFQSLQTLCRSAEIQR
jgi:hypothetical protein